ncbi:MAG: ABC transporter permease [Synergistaceae bacterium]|jgi:lipopolysaccharide transport system permease protein|nr:ABC transporter permease [Synergistaceae bacterium]
MNGNFAGEHGLEHFDLVIEPNKTTSDLVKELVRYRELFYFLAWRDVLVRYKQTVIGVAWAVVRPFLAMVVCTLIFGRAARLPNEGVPYPVLVFSAMLPWQYFASAMEGTAVSMLNNERLITKIYFPRLIVPAASVIVSAVDFLLSLGILLFLMLWYGFLPSANIVFMPVFFLMTTFTALGMGLWLAALNVKYRDFRYVVPFMVQFGLYVSPVGFSSTIVPAAWRPLYSLNPLVGVIDGFRWCIQGTERLYVPGVLISLAASALLIWSGVKFFRRTERYFADFL